MGRRKRKQKLAARPTARQGLFATSPLVAVVALVLYGGALFAGGYFTNELISGGEESSAAAQTTASPTATPTVVVGNVSADDDPALGPSDAEVTIVEFGDYQ